NTSPPTLSNAQYSPLQLDTSGNLKVDVSAGSIAAVQSGAWGVALSSAIPAGANAIGAVSVSNLRSTQAISAASLPLPSGAAADGTDATGVTQLSGGVGIRG